MNNNLCDKVRGSLIGGAIGDALGYPIEFMSLKAIRQKYGDKGYINYQEFNNLGKAVISDDTQMTLFTANGLLNYITRITIITLMILLSVGFVILKNLMCVVLPEIRVFRLYNH